MITFLRRVFIAFLFDELAFTRWARGLMLVLATGGMGFADQLAVLIGDPGAVKTIKVAAVVCGFLSGAITAGERNPREVKP